MLVRLCFLLRRWWPCLLLWLSSWRSFGYLEMMTMMTMMVGLVSWSSVAAGSWHLACWLVAITYAAFWRSPLRFSCCHLGSSWLSLVETWLERRRASSSSSSCEHESCYPFVVSANWLTPCCRLDPSIGPRTWWIAMVATLASAADSLGARLRQWTTCYCGLPKLLKVLCLRGGYW